MNGSAKFTKDRIYESPQIKVNVFSDGYSVLYDDPIIEREMLLLFENWNRPVSHIKARLKALRDALNSVDLEGLI